ncbi:MAG: dihydroorotase [Candidatus Lernaella stagnicola]|nr:dihydroorotase [Candidatus Lernaella stagnicola]
MKTIVTGGRVIDPSQGLDSLFDVVIEKGKVADIVAPGKGGRAKKTIDASGCVVAPGFVDLHVHLREPGFEGKETILTGSRAAVAGGFTTICCMANTEPVNDCSTVTGYILAKAAHAVCKVYPVGAITIDLQGEQIADLGGLCEAGVVALSNDGVPVQNSEIMRRVFELSRQLGMVVLDHAEDADLVGNGLMNESFTSSELGLAGNPSVAEEIAIARSMLLARYTGCHVHICHLSTRGGFELIKWGKRKKIPITCEVAPHHFTLIDEDVGNYNTNCKMAPPLRSREDRAALIKGLADGTVDAIATDHAPHGILLKQIEFDKAANGIIGLETALGLTLRLVQSKKLTLNRAIGLLTNGPADVLGLEAGSLALGRAADICVFDPSSTFVYSTDRIQSKSKNSPFIDWELPGVIRYTLVDGKVAYTG